MFGLHVDHFFSLISTIFALKVFLDETVFFLSSQLKIVNIRLRIPDPRRSLDQNALVCQKINSIGFTRIEKNYIFFFRDIWNFTK